MKQKRSVSLSVMELIQSGTVHMKPRRYYTLLTAVSVVTIVLSSIASAYLFSMLFYWLRIETARTPAWGARERLSDTITSFPWWMLVAAVLLSVFAVWMVRHRGQMYRIRTTTLTLILMVTSLTLGFVLSYVNLGRSHLQLNDSQPQSQSRQHGQQDKPNSVRHRY